MNEELLSQWENGPYVNDIGLVVVPLHPTIRRNWYPWEALGFKYDGHGALVRSVHKEHRGKTYSPGAWLKSSWGKFRDFYPEWSGNETYRIAREARAPGRIAEGLYQVYGGMKAAEEFFGKGYPDHAFYGAIKNQFGITDRAVRRHLQRLARQSYAKLQGAGA